VITRLPRDEMPVATEIRVRDGWTTSANMHGWAIVRPLTAEDLDETTGLLGDASDPALLTLEGTAAALTRLLDGPVAAKQVYPVLAHLMRRGVLLAPLAGLRRSWEFDQLMPELRTWVSQAAEAVGMTKPSRQARRIIANLWLATLEGRTLTVDRDALRRFIDMHLTTEGKGKWLRGIGESDQAGLRQVGASVGADVNRKWSPLIEAAKASLPKHILAEWESLQR
jgi:hypothetical protein